LSYKECSSVLCDAGCNTNVNEHQFLHSFLSAIHDTVRAVLRS